MEDTNLDEFHEMVDISTNLHKLIREYTDALRNRTNKMLADKSKIINEENYEASKQ